MPYHAQSRILDTRPAGPEDIGSPCETEADTA